MLRRPVGRHGDVAAFSLQAKKQVPAGEGGLLVTDDQRIYERAVMLGHCIDRGEQDVSSEEYGAFGRTGFGLNYRIHPVGAALARGALSRLETVLTGRERNYGRLGALLADIPASPAGAPGPRRPGRALRQLPAPVRRGGVGRPAHRGVRGGGTGRGRPADPADLAPLHREAAFRSTSWHPGTYHPGDNAYRVYDGTEFPESTPISPRAAAARLLRRPARPHGRLGAGHPQGRGPRRRTARPPRLRRPATAAAQGAGG
ncbi:DegT/DnrJ/EryC1/StrS family aminotransferase [Streptomyces sp. M19]